MKSTKIRRVFAALATSALVVSTAVAIAPAANAAVACTTTDGVETCAGTLKNGAQFAIKMPSNFQGTMFFWNHGIRTSYTLPGTPFTTPNGLEEMTPYSNSAKADVTTYMLNMGYGVASYDGVSNGLRGWNTAARVEMLKELIETSKAKYPKTARTVVYGSSMAGSILTPFAEKYPKMVDAVGIMSGVTPSFGQSLKSLCDAFYILSVFADPTIKGCPAFTGAGAGGLATATAELGKVVALLRGWQADYGAKPLAYPAALAGGPIPQRSMLLLTGLLVGIPTKSNHMDGISTGGLVPEQSINATVAILENLGEAIATGVLAGHSLAEVIGTGFYDNTKTDYSKLLTDADAGRYNLGLSGDDGVNAMLGVLAAAPRVTGNAAVIKKLENLDKSSFNSTKPFVLMSNEADRLVFPGNQSRLVDKMNASYKKRVAAAKGKATKPVWNVASVYAFTPVKYTQYTATGAPDLTAAPAVSGVGHQDFTVQQMQAWVDMLAFAAEFGPLSAEEVSTFTAGTPYLNTDPGWRPSELKYNK
jgi:pimeloyl-ACP methyl ester carboxylesterase